VAVAVGVAVANSAASGPSPCCVCQHNTPPHRSREASNTPTTSKMPITKHVNNQVLFFITLPSCVTCARQSTFASRFDVQK
jgi:hypothetical protein